MIYHFCARSHSQPLEFSETMSAKLTKSQRRRQQRILMLQNSRNSKKPKIRPALPTPSKWNSKAHRKDYNKIKYQERKQALAKLSSFVRLCLILLNR